MNSIVGKSTGIALLMAAALLAALFSMGVFSATGVGAQANGPTDVDTPAFEDTTTITVATTEVDSYRFHLLNTTTGGADEAAVAVGDVMAVGIDGILNADERGATLSEAVVYSISQEGTDGTFPTAANTAVDEFNVDRLTGAITYEGTDAFDETVQFRVTAHRAIQTSPPNADPTYAEPTDAETGTDFEDADFATTAFVVVEVVPYRLATAEDEAGTSQRLTIQATLDAVPHGGPIRLSMASFGNLSGIETDDVTINDATPSDVDVSGSTVTLYWDDTDDTNGPLATTLSTIVIRKSGGVTLPAKAGNYDIGISTDVTEASATAAVLVNRVTVVRSIKVDPDDGARGGDVTITGKGFNDETIIIRIGTEMSYATPTAVDGAFSVTANTGEKDNEGALIFGSDPRVTTIEATDTDGGAEATFTITPTFSLSTDSPTPGAVVTITLVDVDGQPTSIKFGRIAPESAATAVSGDSTGKKWNVKVPEVSPGTFPLSMMVDGESLKKNITIGTKDLDLSVETAVPGQEITIEGDGFTSDDTSTTQNEGVILAANVTIDETSAVDSNQTVDSNGNISINATVPNVSPGSREVSVKDSAGKIGVATITVPEPSITIEPSESLAGSSVVVTGSGFPANNLIQIQYDGQPLLGGNAATSPLGDFTTTITIPRSAQVGDTVDVVATAQLGVENAPDGFGEAEAEHSTPDPVLTISPAQAPSGSFITISGENYKGLVTVSEIVIAEAVVTPVPSPQTDSQGKFTTGATVLVPALDPSRYTVKINVGGRQTTAFLEVVEEVESNDPARRLRRRGRPPGACLELR